MTDIQHQFELVWEKAERVERSGSPILVQGFSVGFEDSKGYLAASPAGTVAIHPNGEYTFRLVGDSQWVTKKQGGVYTNKAAFLRRIKAEVLPS